jgi:hypothetical protein
MASVFTKLNLKHQTALVIVNAPESFEPELAALAGVRVRRAVGAAREIEFVLAFVTKQREVDTLAKAIAKKVEGDALVWFAYPKGTSKKYTCEFNRDTGWAVLGTLGFEGVRQIAIDEDWSALRFRRTEFIRTMSRQGRQRVAKKQEAGMAVKTVDDYIAGLATEQAAIVAELRAIVRRAAPRAEEAVKWAQPVYASNGPMIFIRAHSKHVNFGFWRGAQMRDAKGLLTGDGDRMRHVKVATLKEINTAAFTDFVKQAVALNAKHGDPTKGR